MSKKKIIEPVNDNYKVSLFSNNILLEGEGETLQEALGKIVIKVVFDGGVLVVTKGEKRLEKVIHQLQMRHIFGKNKTSNRLYARQLEKQL
jgi:hypothetical protein